MPSEAPRNTQLVRSAGFCSFPSGVKRATDKVLGAGAVWACAVMAAVIVAITAVKTAAKILFIVGSLVRDGGHVRARPAVLPGLATDLPFPGMTPARSATKSAADLADCRRGLTSWKMVAVAGRHRRGGKRVGRTRLRAASMW